MNVDNADAVPSRVVADALGSNRWYVSLARVLCYHLIRLWSSTMIGTALLVSVAKSKGNAFFVVGVFVGGAIGFAFFTYPLYTFLKVSGENPDRKPRDVILLNVLAFIFVAGMFSSAAMHNPKRQSISIACAIVLAFPYMLNAFSAHALQRRVVEAG